jgi:outer membrane immunogenic protein
MKKFLRGTAIVSAAFAASTGSGIAATLDDVMAQLQSMQRDNQAIRRDNDEMRKELAALRREKSQPRAVAASSNPSRELPRGVSSAMAAAPASGGYYKAAPISGPYDWSGFYAGLNAGYANGQADMAIEDFGGAKADHSGFLGGAQAGYNWQSGALVLGIEGDIQAATIGGTTTTLNIGPVFAQPRSTLDSFGTVRGRIGYTFDRVLAYGTGGFAVGHTNFENAQVVLGPPFVSFVGSDSQISTGWTAGGGVEYALLDRWSVKAEYLHVVLDNKVFTTATAGYKFDLGRAGVNYHF